MPVFAARTTDLPVSTARTPAMAKCWWGAAECPNQASLVVLTRIFAPLAARKRVMPGKTDSKQTNNNLLLSNEALVNTKPQLEIYADDVKCSHGSTTGQLDDDAIFYLRARGIGDGAARSLLTRAFAGEILDRIPVEAVVRQVRELVADRLGALHQGAST